MSSAVASKGPNQPTLEDEPRKRKILNRSELFAGLPEETLTDFARRALLVRADRRKHLGDPAEPPALHVIGSGRVRVLRTRPNTPDLTLDYGGAGDVVGEMALLEGTEQPDYIACEQVEAVRVPVALIRRQLKEDPRFANRLMKLMGERRMMAENRLEALLTRTVDSRVAQFLREAARRYGVPDSRGTLIGVKFTHQEIASYVGSTRETVTLVLGELKRLGVVLFDHRRIVIVDGAALEKRI